MIFTLLAIAAGAEVLKMGAEVEAAEMKRAAINMQMKETTIQQNQKTISNYDVLQKTLDAQYAQMTTRGVSMSSPSFNAIQRDTLNKAAENQRTINLEGDIARENANIEKANVKNSLYMQLFGDAANAALAFTGVSSSMPSAVSSSAASTAFTSGSQLAKLPPIEW
jgi:hypothetical protein